MSDFAVSALLRPPRMGAQFTPAQLRPPPPRVGRPVPAQFWAPISGRPRRGFVAAHCAVRWTSNVGRPSRPTICAHLAPRSAPTSDHLAPHVRPPSPSTWAATICVHMAPRSPSTSVHLASHVRPPLGSTIRVHPSPPGRPPFAVRGCHNPRPRPPPSRG